MQGIDTHINKSLKGVLKKKYKEFMRSEEVEYTRGGNKKGPSYQQLVDWCSDVWKNLDPEIIKNSFIQTGVTNTGKVDINLLHSKLKDLLSGGKQVEEVNAQLEKEKEDNETGGLTDDEDEDEDEDEEEEELPEI